MRRSTHDKAVVEKRILLFISAQNLLHKKLRSLLTLLGIAIGIGSIYFLLSFGLGLQNLVANEVIGNQSIKTIEVNASNSSIIKIDDVSSKRISEIPSVIEVGSAYYYPGSYKIGNSETDAIIYGINKGYEELTTLNLVSGRLLSEDEEINNALVNLSSLNAIGLGGSAEEIVGKEISIKVALKNNGGLDDINVKLTIVGVIDSGSGSEVFISSHHFRQMNVSSFTQLKVGIDDVENVPQVRSQIESFGFETTSPVDTLNEINTIFRYLNFVLIGFGGIGMIIAVLGMFNTLTISLLERTKEIGLMIALGGRSVDMRLLFILEAFLLSVLGATSGIVVSVIFSSLVNVIMNSFARGRGIQKDFILFSNPWWLIVCSLLFMIIIGIIVVIIPARRAQSINPIDALRRE